MRLLKLFFHQTTPPGPSRGSLEPFLILATFHKVIQVLKQLPGIRDTGELQIPGVWDAKKSRITNVWDNRESQTPGIRFLLFFKLLANLPSSGKTGGFANPQCLGHQGFVSPQCPGGRGVENLQCQRSGESRVPMSRHQRVVF